MKEETKIKIYLGDLIYDTVDTNFVVPLNIAYIAAFIDDKLPKNTEIKLFKYPSDLEKAIKEDPPDVLGLSFYSWNERLSLFFFEMIKEINPNIVTVLGGPNIRTEEHDIKKFLKEHENLDYYIIHEGEEPFCNLVEKIVKDNKNLFNLPVDGCASLDGNKLVYKPVDFGKKSIQMIQPSPYLTGWLDPFLKDPNFIPLLETNRGCPYGCAYCAWGASALSKVRVRPLEQVYAEIEYIANYSAKQSSWIFCDANFGILPRDIDIAKKIRNIMDSKGFPSQVQIWHSKNTSERNIEIVKLIGGSHSGYVALQSTDLDVLKRAGRGGIKFDALIKVLDHYKKENIPVSTDILIGLAGESAESHRQTLFKAFELGFEKIQPYNIRLLPGTEYESEDQRKLYGVRSKYRPIFGSYGIYNGKKVFELEESIRSTADMTEQELNGFKSLHWLIYFAWNGGVFKPLLNYGRYYGVNPGFVLYQLTKTKNPVLMKLFQKIYDDSMNEWFDTQEEMINYYEDSKNFDNMINNFMKLNFLYIARVFEDSNTVKEMQSEIINIISEELKKKSKFDESIMGSLVEVIDNIVCKDLLSNAYKKQFIYSGELVSILMNNPKLRDNKQCQVNIYRSREIVEFSKSHLSKNGKKKLTLNTLVKFFEDGGISALTNKIEITKVYNDSRKPILEK